MVQSVTEMAHQSQAEPDRDAALRPRPGVAAAPVGSETVLWSEQDGVYFGLDEVGTRVWQCISEGATLGRVYDLLLEEYDVDGARLWQDLLKLISDLDAQGLIVRDGDSRGPSDTP
jgi:hypothetical protein